MVCSVCNRTMYLTTQTHLTTGWFLFKPIQNENADCHSHFESYKHIHLMHIVFHSTLCYITHFSLIFFTIKSNITRQTCFNHFGNLFCFRLFFSPFNQFTSTLGTPLSSLDSIYIFVNWKVRIGVLWYTVCSFINSSTTFGC